MMKIHRILVAIFLLITLGLASHGWAGDCRRTAATCVDSTPCKNISGYNVCLANIGISCWKYEDTYECVKPDTVDYCAAIAATPGCNVTNSVCQSTAFNGTCLDYKKTYRCGNAITPAAGVVQLENSYTIVYDQVDTAPCASYSSNPSCQLSAKVCIDGPATKNINGLDVYKACWQWKEDYNCVVSNPKDYCEPLKQAGCTKQSEVCTKTAFTGECIEKKFNYVCEEEAGEPLPTNVVYLDTTYTIVSDTTNNEMCDTFDNNPNCTLASTTCIDGPATKNINGLDVYKDCWQWKKDYSCAATELTSTCQELQNNPNCTETGSVCVDTLPSGACGLLEHQYKCTVSSATTTTASPPPFQTLTNTVSPCHGKAVSVSQTNRCVTAEQTRHPWGCPRCSYRADLRRRLPQLSTQPTIDPACGRAAATRWPNASHSPARIRRSTGGPWRGGGADQP